MANDSASFTDFTRRYHYQDLYSLSTLTALLHQSRTQGYPITASAWDFIYFYKMKGRTGTAFEVAYFTSALPFVAVVNTSLETPE